MPNKKKSIFFFGNGKAEGNAQMRELLGGKGAGLHEMTRIGIPVPPGFTISSEVCSYFYAHRRRYPSGLETNVAAALARIEKILGRRFGDTPSPEFAPGGFASGPCVSSRSLVSGRPRQAPDPAGAAGQPGCTVNWGRSIAVASSPRDPMASLR